MRVCLARVHYENPLLHMNKMYIKSGLCYFPVGHDRVSGTPLLYQVTIIFFYDVIYGGTLHLYE